LKAMLSRDGLPRCYVEAMTMSLRELAKIAVVRGFQPVNET
jgi:hypothetical protein